jgi:hypothetical protein
MDFQRHQALIAVVDGCIADRHDRPTEVETDLWGLSRGAVSLGWPFLSTTTVGAA